MDSAPLAALVRDLDGRITSLSPGASALLGFGAAEALGTPAAALIPAELRAAAATLPCGGPPVLTERLRKDGTRVRVWLTSSPVLDHRGEVIAVTDVLTLADDAEPDTSALRPIVDQLVESTRAESEARLRLALQAAEMGVWEWFPATDTVYWSRECYDIMDAPAFDGTVAGFQRCVHPEDLARVVAATTRSFEDGTELRHEFRVVGRRGTRWVENLARWFPGADGPRTRMIGTVTDITERKLAVAHRLAQEERLSLALAATRTGVCEWDIRTHDVVWSPECYDIVGLTPDQFDGTVEAWERRIHPDDADAVARESAEAVGRREQFRLEFRIIRPDGQVRWIENVARAQYDAAGVPQRMVGTIRDITTERAWREALLDREATFRQLAEGLPHITWTMQADGTEDFMSQRGLAYAGYSQEEMRTRWIETIHPDDRESAIACRVAGLASGAPFQTEFRHRRHDGAWRWHELRCAPVREVTGVIVRWVGSLTDIHEARVLRERLHAQEERITKTAEVTPGVLCSFRLAPDGRATFPYASPSIESLYGLTPAQLAADGDRVFDLVHPDDLPAVQASVAESRRTMAQWRHEWRVRHPERGEVWIAGHSTPVLDADGGVTWHGILLDITDQKRTARELVESGRRFHQVVDSLPHLVWTCGPDGACTFLSRRWAEFTGRAVAEHLGSGWTEQVHPEDRDRVLAEWRQAVATGADHHTELRLRRADGAYRWFDVQGVPLRGADGTITEWFGACTEIEETRRATASLAEEQARLSRIADASPGALHSFRRPPSGPIHFPYASRSLERIYGVPLEQFQRDATVLMGMVHPEDRAGTLAAIDTSARDLTPLHFEARFRRPDGREVWTETHAIPVRDPDGGTTWHGVIKDATERRRTEALLRSSEERVQAVLEHLGEGVVVADLSGRLLSWNRAALQMHGFGDAEAWLLRVPEFAALYELSGLDGRVLPEAEWPVSRILRGERIDNVELRVRRLDTEWRRVFRYGGAIVELPGGGKVGAITITDVTTRHEAERELRQWADAFEHCAHGIAVGIPGRNQLMACNPAYARLLERTAEELRGAAIADLYDAADRPRVQQAMVEADREGQARVEARMLRPEGRAVDVQVDIVSVRGADGAVQYRIATVQDISQRKQAAESLRGMSDWLQAIVRSSPLPIVALDNDGTVLLWNQAAEALFGWSAEEVLGLPFPIVPKDLEAEYDELRQRVAAGRPFRNLQTRRMTRDRRSIDVSISTAPLHDRTGRVMGLVAAYLDLTEQRALRRELSASEERLSLAFKASPSGSVMLRCADRTIVEINQVMCDLSGYPREEVLGKTTQELGGFIPAEFHEALWHRLDTEGRLAQVDYPFRRKDGTARHALVSAERIHLGGEDYILGVFLDVTDRKLAEQALRESEERMRLFVEHAPASLAMFDRDMRYLSVSRRWLTDYALGDRDLRGLCHYDVFPEIGEAWRAVHRRALAGEVVREDADRFVRADGSVHWLRWEVRPWLEASGAVGGILVFSEDITASLAAQEALRDTEHRFRQLAESIREVFWLTAVGKHQMLYISPGYEAIWGRSCQRLYDHPGDWLDAIHPEDRERVLEAAMTRQAAGTYDEEYRIVRPDGSIRWIRDQAFPVRDADGRVVRVAGVAEDITERRQLEAQLRQTQKMESIGLLAGGVAHDFNNWLTVIAGNAELLQDVVPEETDGRELIGEILHAGERAAALTRQLLAFSRREVIEPQVLDLNTVVVDTEKMLRRLLGEDILLTTALAPALPRVLVDPGQWSQVLLNLAVNARDAMPTGGQLTLETRALEVDEHFLRGRPGLGPGRYLQLTISDTGCGMTPEVRARIFEPFYTTKSRGKGTGLGLAVVHGIVTQAGGAIEVYTEPGLGTSFKIYLPTVDQAALGSALEQEVQDVRGTETILLVEDEESVRRVAALALRPHGYAVLQAGNGREALEVAARHPGPIHLLLTDVVMPYMDGRELAATLTTRDPDLRVLYTSGYTDDAVMRHGILQAEVTFLSKPYTPMALLRKARQVLDRK
jgi:two-component system cell cycle sensor histidine kinase/response regulator CckA